MKIKSNQKEYRTLLVRVMVSLLMMGMLVSITSCNAAMSAVSSEGRVLDAKGDYAFIRLQSKDGYADMNAFIEVYFGYPVYKDDKLILITQRHLDSLIIRSQQIIE